MRQKNAISPAIKYVFLLAWVVLVLAGCQASNRRVTKSPPGVAVENMVTFVEIGSLHCTPCKLMMPILENLKQQYKGRVAVKFIDVNKYPDLARQLKIMTIPTQIVYDRSGHEVVHHIGFFPQEQIEKELAKILNLKHLAAQNG